LTGTAEKGPSVLPSKGGKITVFIKNFGQIGSKRVQTYIKLEIIPNPGIPKLKSNPGIAFPNCRY
jgi:hypothetical protein